MEALCSFETSVDTQRTTRRYIPEDGTLHNHRCENLKSYTVEVYFLAEGGGSAFLRNVDEPLPNYTLSLRRR
jgi:hypothetical protein